MLIISTALCQTSASKEPKQTRCKHQALLNVGYNHCCSINKGLTEPVKTHYFSQWRRLKVDSILKTIQAAARKMAIVHKWNPKKDQISTTRVRDAFISTTVSVCWSRLVRSEKLKKYAWISSSSKVRFKTREKKSGPPVLVIKLILNQRKKTRTVPV